MNTPQPKQTQRFEHDGRIGAVPVVMVLLLVALPGYALSRFATWADWRLLVGIPVAVSLFTYFAYRSDKRRAEAGEWRVPESTLHLGELCGGWPGAFLAQRKYRHKTAKASFQITFWTIVLIHQFAAFDSLIDWKFTKQALDFIQAHSRPRSRLDRLVTKWHHIHMEHALEEPRKRITARVSDKVRITLEQAAELLGATVNQFVVQTAYEEAQRVLERESVIRLSQKDARKILSLLDSPPKPGKALKDAVKAFEGSVRA